jgi:Amt family ammonium transporter
VLSIGIFADGTYGDGWNGVPGKVTGLLYGNGTQIIAQTIGVVANVVYIGLISIIVYKLIDVVIGNRVSAAAEIEGLDIPEMGIPGYVGVADEAEAEHARSGGVMGRPVPAEGR